MCILCAGICGAREWTDEDFGGTTPCTYTHCQHLRHVLPFSGGKLYTCQQHAHVYTVNTYVSSYPLVQLCTGQHHVHMHMVNTYVSSYPLLVVSCIPESTMYMYTSSKLALIVTFLWW